MANQLLNSNQIVSKQRVADHGEVLTAEREVNAMLDLVKPETRRIDSRFLEPACGTGNFLAIVLERKLALIEKRYSRSQIEFERNSFIALASIYGIEILPDSLKLCRDRLLGIFTHYYLKNYKKRIKPEYLKAAEFVLNRNILWGDALTLKTPDEKAEPIVFSEWTRPFNDSRIKRREYFFSELTQKGEVDLFSTQIVSDTGESGFIPEPHKEFPLTHYLRIYESN